jgi:hypothetical protein
MKTTIVRSSLFTLTLVFGAIVGVAQPVSPYETGQRPTREGEPTQIRLQLVLIDLTNINGSNQSFTADLFMLMSWHDHRLADPSRGTIRVPVDQVWNPMIQIVNQQGVDATFPEIVDITADGTVTYRQRIYGDFSAPMDLHEFPMDEHRIGFRFVVPRYSPAEVELIPGEGDSASVRSPKLSIVDWKISDFTVEANAFTVVAGGPQIAGVSAHFLAVRKLGFYMSKAFLSVAIIVLMSWIVFWVDSSFVAPRMSIAVTSMLTLIAYRFLLGGVLPPLSYLTRMDHFLLASTLLVLVAIIQVATTTHLNTTDRPDRAASLNRMSRWAFPLVFVVASAIVFTAG